MTGRFALSYQFSSCFNRLPCFASTDCIPVQYSYGRGHQILALQIDYQERALVLRGVAMLEGVILMV